MIMDDILLEQLRMLKASIENWQEDRACKLMPTEGSLAAALVRTEIAIALRRDHLKDAQFVPVSSGNDVLPALEVEAA